MKDAATCRIAYSGTSQGLSWRDDPCTWTSPCERGWASISVGGREQNNGVQQKHLGTWNDYIHKAASQLWITHYLICYLYISAGEASPGACLGNVTSLFCYVKLTLRITLFTKPGVECIFMIRSLIEKCSVRHSIWRQLILTHISSYDLWRKAGGILEGPVLHLYFNEPGIFSSSPNVDLPRTCLLESALVDERTRGTTNGWVVGLLPFQ